MVWVYDSTWGFNFTRRAISCVSHKRFIDLEKECLTLSSIRKTRRMPRLRMKWYSENWTSYGVYSPFNWKFPAISLKIKGWWISWKRYCVLDPSQVGVSDGLHRSGVISPSPAQSNFLFWTHWGTGCSGTSNKNNKFSHQDREGWQELTLGRKYEEAPTGCRGFFLICHMKPSF